MLAGSKINFLGVSLTQRRGDGGQVVQRPLLARGVAEVAIGLEASCVTVAVLIPQCEPASRALGRVVPGATHWRVVRRVVTDQHAAPECLTGDAAVTVFDRDDDAVRRRLALLNIIAQKPGDQSGDGFASELLGPFPDFEVGITD